MLNGLMNRRANSLISSAAADVARHGDVDILIARIFVFLEQRDRLHDLAGLTVAALRDADFHPCLLYGMHRSDAFDGRDLGAADLFHRSDAGADGRAVLMHGAGSAQRHAAAKLCSRELRHVTQIPEQWHVGIAVEGSIFAVYCETDHGSTGQFAIMLSIQRWLMLNDFHIVVAEREMWKSGAAGRRGKPSAPSYNRLAFQEEFWLTTTCATGSKRSTERAN